ncbi:hypothetical protein [Ferrovum sp.]|uniref:hypothetical protein n=1 Tax=Ferrovum sp. TaxID=2609467 RepID=UPI0026169AAA|nr:hypothetical protein [Ferrovum sp.]
MGLQELNDGFERFLVRNRFAHRLHVLRHAFNDTWPFIGCVLLGAWQPMALGAILCKQLRAS